MDNSTKPQAADLPRDVSYGGSAFREAYEEDRGKQKKEKVSIYSIVSGIGILSAVVMVVMALISVGSSLM